MSLQTLPTPEQIARHGHIAVLLRRYLDQTGMRMADFHEHVLRMSRTAGVGSLWLHAKNCPGAPARRTLSRVMGVPEAFFKARDPDNPQTYPEPPETLKVPSTWISRGHPRNADKPSTELAVHPATSVQLQAKQPVLSFALYSDNTASVRLQADNLDGDHGKSLLRILLEAGLVNTPTTTKNRASSNGG
jgi:hypothetical protein